MKLAMILFSILFLFFGCSKEPKVLLPSLPNTAVTKSTFEKLPNFNSDNFDLVLSLFKQECEKTQLYHRYKYLCDKATHVEDSKKFILENFQPYLIVNKKKKSSSLLTGYYEAQVSASLTRSKRYRYPIYSTPDDLLTVRLTSIYPDLDNYRLRGRVEKAKLVPYYTRAEANSQELNASVLCYCDSKIDRFFLEVQGSGIAKMDDNSSVYLGYANQNGYKYRSIGKYLIDKDELSRDEVSLQSIKKWLLEHPTRVDEVLNYNKSMIFFSKRDQGATGALGIKLTPMRSVAVDKSYIPLGSMLYLSADLNSSKLNRIVFAQDTGGAINGSVRADLFVGRGERALQLAGRLKAPLKLWILLPKERITKIDE
jgi:membrane-bound lytic murein transglycosylase A